MKKNARCLRSIRNLDFSQLTDEVVILDNVSTENTHLIIEEMGFPFKVTENIHVSGLRNRGVAIAQGEYLAFFDSNVEMSSWWLEPSLAGFTDPMVVAG